MPLALSIDMRRKPSLPFSLPVCAGAAVLGLAGTAHASFGPCEVPVVGDPQQAAIKLRNCVDNVNAGGPYAPQEIVFEGPQEYALDAPIELERDVTIHGAGQAVRPQSGFTGDSLFVVGCSGPQCSGAVDIVIEGMELFANGENGIRGIDVRPNNILLVDDAYLHDLGAQGDGGCIRAQSGSELHLHGGTLERCAAGSLGGAVFLESALSTIDGSTLHDNTAMMGGGVYIASPTNGTRKLTMWDVVLTENEAAFGGGLYTEDFNIATNISGSTFFANDASERGGGLYGGADISTSTFEANSADNNGGGALLRTGSTISTSTFRANDAWRGGGVSVLVVEDKDIHLVANTFVANTSSTTFPGTPWGAGVMVARGDSPPPLSTTFIRNCTFSGNVAMANGIGGGLGLGGATAVVEHTTFSDNEAFNGRAIFTSSSGSTDLTLRSSIVANSTASATAPVCSIGSSFQTTTSLDTDGSCGVAVPTVDPLLGPLTNNGGQTETYKPTAPEVLGTAACFEPFDQVGNTRPGSGCDMGSLQQ